MDMWKLAFDYGRLMAYAEQQENIKEAEDFKWPWAPEEKPSIWSTWKPYVGGAAIGLGAYGLLKHPFKVDPSKYPELRKVQDLAAGEFTHIMAEPPAKPQNWWENLYQNMFYGPRARLTGGGQIPKSVRGTENNPKVVLEGYKRNPPKGVIDPSIGAVSGPEAAARYDRMMALEDKQKQYELLSKYAPGTMAKTMPISELLAKRGLKLDPNMSPEELQVTLQKIQEAAREEFAGKEYIIKTRNAREGGDPSVQSNLYGFPTQQSDLAKLLQEWRPHGKKFYELAKKSPGEAVGKFSDLPSYPGRVVEEMLHDNALFQERLPIDRYYGQLARDYEELGFAPMKDYRIHSFLGRAAPSLAGTRFLSDDFLSNMVNTYKARKAAKWFQKEVLDKLPPEYRQMAFGADIAPLQGGGYRVIELNPGGQSGILDYPEVEGKLHRFFTGRSTEPVARAGGIGAGILGTGAIGGAGSLANRFQSEQ